jgi:glycosyltransferase involved in cell wall biosynthesis
VSVLLPIHRGLDVRYLARALDSVAAQTRRPDQVVVVIDGPVTPAHDALLEGVSSNMPMDVVRLPTNGGAGVANQAGLLQCRGEWVMKADGDDVSVPERLERQLEHVLSVGADVCGSSMWEFEDDETNIVSVRTPPLTHPAIARRMRWNNPLNHPTTLYRTEFAKTVGGYGDLRYMQDYDLFARMLAAGARFANLAEPLVLFRAGDAVMSRRRSPALRRCEWQLQRNHASYGVVSPPRRYANFVARQGARMLPEKGMTWLHRALFSRKVRPPGAV